MIFAWIFISIFIFSLIILLHEYWHFKVARIFGVKVYEFGLGIPPRAKRLFTDKKWTDYTLNWLPLGGFVKLKGESLQTFSIYDEKKKLYNNAQLEQDLLARKTVYDRSWAVVDSESASQIFTLLQDNHASDSLLTKPYYQQALVILAGVIMNFLTAWVIFSVLFMIGVQPIGINSVIKTDAKLRLIPTQEQAFEYGILEAHSGVYLTPLKWSIAEKSGIKANDLLLWINQKPIDGAEEVMKIIWESKEIVLTLDIERENTTCETKDCPKQTLSLEVTPSNDWKIWTYIAPNISVHKNYTFQYGIVWSVKAGGEETIWQIILTFQALSKLFSNIFFPKTPIERQEAIEQVSWPIGIVHFITGSINYGIIFLTILAAIISINLGVFNLLPIPALDGGRFLFILVNSFVEKIFGKKMITERFEWYLHVGFFLFFIALSFLIAYNDVNHIIHPKLVP